MAVIISPAHGALAKYEYGCDLRRLYPWAGVSDPGFWGAAIASVRPGEATTPHSHDEEETFIILSGSGQISVDDDHSNIAQGDVVYLPRHSHHSVVNHSADAPLVFLTIFWGSPEAYAALQAPPRIVSPSPPARPPARPSAGPSAGNSPGMPSAVAPG